MSDDLRERVRAALERHGLSLSDPEVADVVTELDAILRGQDALDELDLAAVEPTTFVRFEG